MNRGSSHVVAANQQRAKPDEPSMPKLDFKMIGFWDSPTPYIIGKLDFAMANSTIHVLEA